MMIAVSSRASVWERPLHNSHHPIRSVQKHLFHAAVTAEQVQVKATGSKFSSQS